MGRKKVNMKSKKEYIIVGSNNFWYASGLDTLKEVKEELEYIQRNWKRFKNEYKPELLYVYEVKGSFCISCKS
jgi:hypothetical protein